MDRETLIRWVELQLGQKGVKPDDRFYDDLGAESVDMVHLIALIEENTGIFIPEDAIPDLQTVNDLYEFILQNQPS
jgi:acyl carrier protein